MHLEIITPETKIFNGEANAVMLPGLDGITLCQQLRSQGYLMPILMITARDTVSDKITGLDAGADDYIVRHWFSLIKGRNPYWVGVREKKSQYKLRRK
jgi:PleD family two-component response regulator